MIIKSGEGQYELTYEIHLMGKDVQILVWGGDVHIGAVTVIEKGTITTWKGKSHKDDILTEALAKEIYSKFLCTCVVSAGFHLKDITPEGISQVLHNHKIGCQRVISWLEEKFASRGGVENSHEL